MLLFVVSQMDHSEHDCILITVMTHGDVGVISSHDGDYTIETVTALFTDEKCPSLKGKPRIFFIQACRGGKLDDGYNIRIFEKDKYNLHRRKRSNTDIALFALNKELQEESEEEYEVEKIPEVAFYPPIYEDFLIVRSTMPYHLSFRNLTEGSWFIQDLCKELEVNGAACDILNLLTHVNLSVSERESKELGLNNKKQILCISSKLTKILRLNKQPHLEGRSETLSESNFNSPLKR
jgi:caspase 7